MTFAGPQSALQPFSWPISVYYEDTDAAGVVYYANYLKFLERARTEWLAALGIAVPALETEHKAIFVVHRLEIDYRRPARLGEALRVTVAFVECSRSKAVAIQEVIRSGDVLASARVVLVCINPRTWRPTRIPAPVLAQMESTA